MFVLIETCFDILDLEYLTLSKGKRDEIQTLQRKLLGHKKEVQCNSLKTIADIDYRYQ